MTIDEATDFFEPIPKNLSQTENNKRCRFRLYHPRSTEHHLIWRRSTTDKTSIRTFQNKHWKYLYILDEPTTGLHFEDIKVLMEVLQKLVDKGNSVLVIEHNMDVIKLADYIFDIGYEGGKMEVNSLQKELRNKLLKTKKAIQQNF